MGRIRTVKPELIQQPWFATLSDAAARTYYGLLAVVDDAGRCAADPSFIAGQIFWGRQRTAGAIGRQLAELERAGIILIYSARGGKYLEIQGWHEKGGAVYQQVNKPQGERFPAPDSNHDRPADRPGTGPDPKANTNRNEDPPAPARATPAVLAAGPVAGDLELRQAARAMLWRELGDLRRTIAAELGLDVRPLLAQDPGERELALRLAEVGSGGLQDAIANARHVMAMAAAEARRPPGSVQWLTGVMFEARSWRRALGMTLADARRAGPKRAPNSSAVGRVEPHEPSAYTAGDVKL